MKTPQIGTVRNNPIKILDPKGLKEFLAAKTSRAMFAEAPSDVFQRASEEGMRKIELDAEKILGITGRKANSPQVEKPLLNLDFLIKGVLNAPGIRIKGDVTAKNSGVGIFETVLGDAFSIGEESLVSVKKGIKGRAVASDDGVISAGYIGSYADASRKGKITVREGVDSFATATQGGGIRVDGYVFGDVTAGKDSFIEVKNAMHNARTYQGGEISAENVLGNTDGKDIHVKSEVFKMPWENFDKFKRFAFLRTLNQAETQ